jgi:hypothetical protein
MGAFALAFPLDDLGDSNRLSDMYLDESNLLSIWPGVESTSPTKFHFHHHLILQRYDC